MSYDASEFDPVTQQPQIQALDNKAPGVPLQLIQRHVNGSPVNAEEWNPKQETIEGLLAYLRDKIGAEAVRAMGIEELLNDSVQDTAQAVGEALGDFIPDLWTGTVTSNFLTFTNGRAFVRSVIVNYTHQLVAVGLPPGQNAVVLVHDDYTFSAAVTPHAVAPGELVIGSWDGTTYTPTPVFFPEGIQGDQGPQGPPGPQGPKGDPNLGYNFTQATAASTWTINHNLGVHPNVQLFSLGGTMMMAEVQHTSVNQTVVTFLSPVAGFARLA